jgi:hypothetical protein
MPNGVAIGPSRFPYALDAKVRAASRFPYALDAKVRAAMPSARTWKELGKMPAKGTKGTRSQKDVKRRIVAAGAITGKRTSEIAKDANCSERHALRLAAETETKFIIANALSPYREQLRKMAGKAVRAVDRAFVARKTDKADHFTQLKAVERYGDLLELAAGDTRYLGKDADAGRHLVTWQEFILIGKQRREVVE